jgi:hypothetical protein
LAFPRQSRRAGVVEQDHLAVTGQAVGHGRVPIVHGPCEVLEKDERNTLILSKTTINETDASSIHQLGSCCLMSVVGHDDFL